MKKSIKLIIILGLGTLLYGVALSATYNFYFNNIEQGENGTASPSLSVTQDGEAMRVEGAENQMAPSNLNESSSPIASGSSHTVLSQHETMNRWRIIPARNMVWSDYSYRNGDFYHGRWGWELNLGYQISRAFNLNVFWGRNSEVQRIGGEVEIELIHIGNRLAPWIQLAALGGVSNLVRLDDTNPFVFHLGGRLTFNFLDQLGVTSSVRVVSQGGTMVGAGLVVNL